MFDLKKFTTRLRSLRVEAGYTQKEIAEILDIGAPSYQRYENATREPKLRALCLLAETYSVTTDYLLGLTDVRNSQIANKVSKDKTPSGVDKTWKALGNVLTDNEKERVLKALTGHDFPPYNEVEK